MSSSIHFVVRNAEGGHLILDEETYAALAEWAESKR